MATRIQIRRDTSTNWAANNPVLALGEPGYETDTFIIKYGDGSTAWNSLPYANIDSLADFTTSDLNEGTNLYFSNARVYANLLISGLATTAYIDSQGFANNSQLTSYATTSSLSSYATNNQLSLYATNADLIANYLTTEYVDIRLQSYAKSASLTTNNVSEITNLYYTNARVLDYVTSLDYATNSQVSGLTTDNITENNNLYFSNARVISAITTQTLSNATFSGNVSGIAEIGKTTTSANSIGYIGLPQNIQNSDYTLVIGDMAKHMFATGNLTFTIPSRISVPYPIGTSLTFVSNVSCTANIAIINDVMYLSNTGSTGTRTLTQFGKATALKVSDSIWIISGTGLS